MRYAIKLEHNMTATLVVEADTEAQAIKMWEDGDYEHGNIEFDESLHGGIPWERYDIEEIKQ